MGRVVRLVQAADLDAWQRVLMALCRADDPRTSASRVMLVPSRNAAEQFRRTLERRVLDEGGATPVALTAALGLPPVTGRASVLVPPRMVTRGGWYDLLHEASGDARPRVSPIASEVLMATAARAVSLGDVPAPFLLRPGLVAEMVAFRDALRRLGHDVLSAGAHLLPDLEAEASTDRGAARLLAQTRFLLAVFAAYESRLETTGVLDEDAVRRAARLAAQSAPHRWPLTHLIVTVGDHQSDAGGLWPADFDLLDTLPVTRLDIVCTRRQAQAGLARRVTARWPEALHVQVDAQRARGTTLETPQGGARWFTSRDREEEVLAFARRIKAAPRDQAAALVYRRPLPYLYLAQEVLTASGIPYETSETLPLAAEPWAAAVDVLVDSILADHTRATLVALLRHPHFQFEDEEGALPPPAISAFERLLARDRYLGTPDRLADLVQAWRVGRTAGQVRDLAGALRVAGVVLPLLGRLAPLRREAPPASHLDLIADTLDRLARPIDGREAAASRGRRVRAAVREVIDTLREALRVHDPRPARAREVCAVLRRWIEQRTFAPHRDGEGVQVLDADAARFGAFDRLRLVGMVEGEWPEASARNIFYPGFLLARLGWPDERERAAATRAAFADLLELPAVAVGVSLPELEQDAVVRPSSLLDELAMFGPSRQAPVPADEASLPVVPEAAMLAARVPVTALARLPETSDWLAWRMRRASARPVGQTEPLPPGRYSVTAVERYLQCPFQYFATSVLRLAEEPEDEAGLPSRDAGVFVHDVLQACFAAWQASGRTRITPDDLPAARALFQGVAERALERLPAADRPLERLRLFGSAVTSGLLEKVLRVDVESFGDVVSRELEVDVDGHVAVPDGAGTREIAIRGRVDRVDRTVDGGVRVIDYKSGRRPQQEGLQPGIYALALTSRDAAEGRRSSVAPSGYVALREVAPWGVTVRDAEAAADDARQFGEAVAGIEGGAFPVRPASIFRCRYCDFGSVCRKDYVGDD